MSSKFEAFGSPMCMDVELVSVRSLGSPSSHTAFCFLIHFDHYGVMMTSPVIRSQSGKSPRTRMNINLYTPQLGERTV